jgi:molybdenum cofactor biosynthesis enzyme MoaA
MGSGRLPPDCPQWCPLLSNRQQWFQKQELYEYSRAELASFDKDFLANRARVLGSILDGGDLIDDTYPLRLHLHPSDVCNLRCVMCYLDLDSGRKRDWYGGPRLRELMRYLEEIKIFGGEPLFCETSRGLILSTEKPPWTHTSFLTNGMLVTDRVIQALETVRIGSVDVSLDAADAATYERVRLRGDFDKAVAGARRLVDLGRRHSIRQFSVFADFVIQEANYRDLERFVGLCADIGITPNFTIVTGSLEAKRRSLIQRTELGVRPQSFADLNHHLEGAIAYAQQLRMTFAVESLQRARDQVHQAQE